jgi:sulfhydrogenase subunit gamma (sulfur reductase)
VLNPYQVQTAEILEKIEETERIYSFRLRLTDAEARRAYRFEPGQFNMLSAFGVGEVAISIVSDPDEPDRLDHTIRIVGRVTGAIERLRPGDALGIRGPFGRGWPMATAQGKDVIFVTGGLGCAPVAGAMEYIFRRRGRYGAVKILHGVRKPTDLLYGDRFEAWRRQPDTEVHLTSDEPGRAWRYHVGVVTELFEEVSLDPSRTIVMMCGPEVMMRFGAEILQGRGIPFEAIHVSLERHMECGIGLCGHCQLGPFFVCKDGPVMRYDRVVPFLGRAGV